MKKLNQIALFASYELIMKVTMKLKTFYNPASLKSGGSLYSTMTTKEAIKVKILYHWDLSKGGHYTN